MTKLLYVMAGGAIGSGLRYGAGLWLHPTPGRFPMATFLVNALGCALFGTIAGWMAGSGIAREELRLALLVGLLGGFTTFSSFGFESMKLLEGGHTATAISYIALSNIVGIGAAFTAYRVSFSVLS